MADYTHVIPTTVNNLKAAARFRPIEFINWAKLVKPLRQSSTREGASFDLYALAFHLFTRLPFDYSPAAARPDLSPPRPPHRTDLDQLQVGLFADAPEHLSGVATTLGHWNRMAKSRNQSFKLHSAGDQPVIPDGVCFPRMGSFRLHAYDGLTLHMPRVDEVLDYIAASRFDVLHISTPGPMGMIALLAAKTLQLPVVSTFHTHFPSYVQRLTGDDELTQATWSFMRWFYSQMHAVAAPTPSVRDELITQGVDPARIHIVGRGVDRQRFSPRFRDEGLRLSWGPHHLTRLVYVGRLSKEKNLDCLVDAFLHCLTTRPELQLILVGDGPYRPELEARLEGTNAVFAGTRKGEDLARHYASGDLFVFPSQTDTLGNVVLEAQASGLPVVVSSHGGPKDCMQDGVTGLVIPDLNASSLAENILELTRHPETLDRMGAAARTHSRRYSHEAAFDAFWALHPTAQTVAMEQARNAPSAMAT